MNLRERKRLGWIQSLILIICLGAFLFSVIKIATIYYDYSKNEKVMNEIQAEYQEIQQNSESEAAENQIRSPFQNLLKINPDIVGWLTIDHTKVHYPILQSSDNEYYLKRNYKKEESKAGSIFMDFRNEVDTLNRQTIIYGHEMKDGSMFGQLKKFLDEEFASQNKHFQFDTIYARYDVEVFSAYVTTTDFQYLQTDFASDEEYKQFLQVIKENSEVQTNVQVTEKDHIITLSTCNNLSDPDEGRLVIHGKLTKID